MGKNDEPVSTKLAYEENDGRIIINGDMVIPRYYIAGSNSNAVGNISRIVESTRWFGGEIPYTLDPDLPGSVRKKIKNAITYINGITQFKWISRTDEENYVFITKDKSSGCLSNVGRLGGEQKIWLSSACDLPAVIHELSHTMGLWHEHQRPDRDAFIRIKAKNVRSGTFAQFVKLELIPTDNESLRYSLHHALLVFCFRQ